MSLSKITGKPEEKVGFEKLSKKFLYEHLHDITILQNSRIVFKRRKVTHTVVDRNRSRESNALRLNFLLRIIVNARNASVDELVTQSTQLYNALTGYHLGDKLVDHIYMIQARKTN